MKKRVIKGICMCIVRKQLYDISRSRVNLLLVNLVMWYSYILSLMS